MLRLQSKVAAKMEPALRLLPGGKLCAIDHVVLITHVICLVDVKLVEKRANLSFTAMCAPSSLQLKPYRFEQRKDFAFSPTSLVFLLDEEQVSWIHRKKIFFFNSDALIGV